MRSFRSIFVLACLAAAPVCAERITIPAGTPVYGELQEVVVSKKKETSEGDMVRALVWRNVVVDGRTVVKAGSPMLVRVSKVKKAKFAGIKGKLELGAESTRAVDGSDLLLDGGYDKSGRGKKALSISLAAVVAWPLIFIKGKQARLDPGTVFDATVQADFDVEIGADAPASIRISSPRALEARVLEEEMADDAKSKTLPVELVYCEGPIEEARVVTVNDQEIDAPVPVLLSGGVKVDDCAKRHGEIGLKELGKHFRKGINRFEIGVGAERAEIVLDVEL